VARAAARDQLTDTAADAAIDQACRILRLPTIRDRHGEVAAAAARQQASYKGFLVELLSIECDDREQRRKARLVREAAFPRPKRLEDFDYAANPNVPAALIHTLAAGTWVAAGQPGAAADVQLVLGHAQLTTTQIYLRPRAEDVIRRVLAHHAGQSRAASDLPVPAPGYRPETLDVPRDKCGLSPRRSGTGRKP